MDRYPILLGIADRSAHVREPGTPLGRWNVLGLRSIVFTHILPMRFPEASLAIAFPVLELKPTQRFYLMDDAGLELGFIDVNMTMADEASGQESEGDPRARMVVAATGDYFLHFLQLSNMKITVMSPGDVHFRWGSPDGPHMGRLSFHIIDPPRLDDARINAIRASPAAAKAIRLAYGCATCNEMLRTYAALSRSATSEAEGWKWFEDLPDTFACSCGKAILPLEIVRRNLHGLLGQRPIPSGDVSLIPLYEESVLSDLRRDVIGVLATGPREEVLQQLIEKNPVLLSQFPAVRFFKKPPILTSFVADFAIVTPQRELLLIEIERPALRILKKDGGMTAELTHAFDQVRSWLHIVEEHRLAVLDSLEIPRDEVATVRGVVIAGRDIGYDPLHLRRMKGQLRDKIAFHTFDDLVFALDSLIGKIAST